MMISFLGGYVTISAILEVFLHFQSLCFSKILIYLLKIYYENFNLTTQKNFLLKGSVECNRIHRMYPVQMATKIVLEVDALPKH